MAMLTTDELANPHLYHPRVTGYVGPAFTLPAPPAGVVRPAEFDEMDSVLITVMNYGTPFLDMWVDMVDVYRNAGRTYVVVNNSSLQNNMTTRFDNAGIPSSAYTYVNWATDSIWIRDYGPELVRAPNGVRHVIDAYYPGRPLDDVIPGQVAAAGWIGASALEVHDHVHTLSGGNIMTDGAGTCFFSDIVYGYEKPSGWSAQDVTDLLTGYYGCEQIVVLNPICLDGTGHIDLYAKSMGPTSILLGEFSPETHFDGSIYVNDPWNCSEHYINDYQDQEDNLAILEASTNVDGDPWQITRLPMPEPYQDGQYWVYRSYMNSQVFNGWVAMPSYYDTHGETYQDLLDMEAAAIDAYETAAPGISVVAIDSDHIIPLAGAIHCITHEIPAEFPATDADSDGDSDTDADGDSDADSDGDADGDDDDDDDDDSGDGVDDAGCGCAATGYPRPVVGLAWLLAGLR
jgi:agmatine deiminase